MTQHINTETVAPTDDPVVADQEAATAEVEAALVPTPSIIERTEAAQEAKEEEVAAQLAAQKKTDVENDWRVRLHLPPQANYLYKSSTPGILTPLLETNGIIFPYTPTLSVQYNANYENYDLIHSNYRGYFYKGSTVQNILINATFTVQDTAEANYLLATMHFLRSATKMFYGQDPNRGMPPPVVMLTGFGEYQFKNHPCAITLVSYNLPNDVDYIQAKDPADTGADPTNNFVIHKVPKKKSGKEGRIESAGLSAGAETFKPPVPVSNVFDDNQNRIVKPEPTAVPTRIYDGTTYVPTKLDISFTMIPIQTRNQVSKEFSFKDYASGKLLKKGFW